ncbi:hypothetical protein MYXO_03582 [Myxococcaceae bacterium]|jgi:hypothetical protein|nr:hypothetical protein MYXO_03582 [Myxococcaceae bacterium]
MIRTNCFAALCILASAALGSVPAASQAAEPEAIDVPIAGEAIAPSEVVASEGAPASGAVATEVAAVDVSAAPPAAAEVVESLPEAEPRSFRIGFWAFDLFAVDREPRGTTFRLLDFKIFKLFEFGQGEDYQAVSVLEMPDLFSPFTARREANTSETHVLDFEALSFAVFRGGRESESPEQTHVLKLPVLGSVYSMENDLEQPEQQEETFFFLLRRDTKP